MYQNESTKTDDELADFADRVLKGKADIPASTTDPELLSLEKTILRLNAAFPPESLEDAKAKQMLVRLKARMRREEEETAAPSFWRRLFDFQSNPQVGLILAAVAVVVIAIVSLPSLEQSAGPLTTGTAFSGSGFIAAGVLLALVVFYWLSHRNK